mmetsp:Transcript_79643/g.237225  ORF Transcript_79643/g.237225 Transcript_79643/m.237225 type:complete len:459 (+) Transcript_79643:169-1545(+)
MVHSHSPEKLRARTQRAIAKGFIVPHSAPGKSYIEVDANIKKAAVAVVRSMEVHRHHDALSGSCHHHARLATFGARPLLPPTEADAALRLHRRAGRAKHGVSRPSPSTSLTGSSPSPSSSTSPCSTPSSTWASSLPRVLPTPAHSTSATSSAGVDMLRAILDKFCASKPATGFKCKEYLPAALDPNAPVFIPYALQNDAIDRKLEDMSAINNSIQHSISALRDDLANSRQFLLDHVHAALQEVTSAIRAEVLSVIDNKLPSFLPKRNDTPQVSGPAAAEPPPSTSKDLCCPGPAIEQFPVSTDHPPLYDPVFDLIDSTGFELPVMPHTFLNGEDLKEVAAASRRSLQAALALAAIPPRFREAVQDAFDTNEPRCPTCGFPLFSICSCDAAESFPDLDKHDGAYTFSSSLPAGGVPLSSSPSGGAPRSSSLTSYRSSSPPAGGATSSSASASEAPRVLD